MKNYLTLLSFVLSFGLFGTLQGAHLAGGDIQYRYIGDSTGINHHYLVILRVYYSDWQTTPPVTNNVTYNSSCFSQKTISVTRKNSNFAPPTYYDCVPPSSPNTIQMYVGYYEGPVVLDGQCADHTFWWADWARSAGISNIMGANGNTGGGKGFYFEAKLNNTLGNNSSPIFVSEPVRAFCVGQTFNWSQQSIEFDGDSIRYSLIHTREGNYNNHPNIPFDAGWSATQPIRSVPPISFNASTGLITFTPTNSELDVMAILIEEYRFDSLFGTWINVGSSNRDMMVSISPQCDPSVADGVVLDYNDPMFYIDPITGKATVDYPCHTDRVTLKFSVALDCSSVDQGDFRLTRPDGQPIPIEHLTPNCDFNNESIELEVKLFKPLYLNGDYILYSKIGNDGNTLINKCGFAMPEFDTIILRVEDCPDLDWDLVNVSVIENTYPEVTWEWDQTGIPSGVFAEFEIQRSPNNGMNYYVAGTEPDSTITVFEDLQITTVNVNERFYRYQLAVKLIDQYIDTTRSIRSIFLHHINANLDGTETVQLRWNSYDGWPDVEYSLMFSKDEGGPLNWQPLNVPQNPTMDTVMDFNMPESWEAGDYNLRIDASDSNGVIAFISHSNWISFELKEPPLPLTAEIEIPSVFTPNNDGRNDFFTIANIDKWTTRRAVVIYNRWGKKVYEATLYENDNPWDGSEMSSGATLPDGVYFYVIDIENEPTNESEQHKGTVTISRGN